MIHRMHSLLFIFFSVSAFLLSGCGIEGTIFNHADFNVEVKRMGLAEGKNLKILQHETIRYIKLKEVEEIQIDPSEMVQFERQLYYLLTKINLKSGEAFESSTRPKPGLSEPKAYICVVPSIAGKTKDGVFRISLSDVAKIIVE
ncbi:MAG: hypothetical protein GF401_18945 [Chitinivibrionales bacterium]|nr:hypothetical protein [Chitinivibrionales bacterium]